MATRTITIGVPDFTLDADGTLAANSDTVATDCTWEGVGCGFLRDADYEVLFVRNTMRTPGIWTATSAGTRPHITAVDCTFDQSAGGSKLKTTPQSTPVIDLVRCEWTGPQTQGFAVNIEGGLLRLTDSVIPANSRALLPGVIEG